MTQTMSMVRSGIFLMGAFSALAGLFLLLSADLLASMQLMMYIGGMLVMILFMVKMSMDPGGAMMGIAPPEEAKQDMQSMKEDNSSKTSSEGHQMGGMQHDQVNQQDMPGATDSSEASREGHSMGGMHHDQMGQEEMQGGKMPEMDMKMDMSMTNEFTKPAAVAGVLSSLVLLSLLYSVHWPPAAPANTANAALMVGKELLGRYMIAFEAGGLLILLGVVGATIFGGKE
jgi:NADH-quinone oxidoreductase subunit J